MAEAGRCSAAAWAPSAVVLAVAVMALLCAASIAAAQSEVVEYYHHDAVGSIRAVTNEAGQVIRRYDYMPFGELWQPTYPIPERRLFIGQERDHETGLDYFGARYYRPDIGRFTTVDPAKGRSLPQPQTWNRYSYALNNPLRYADPDGRWPTAIHNLILRKAFPGLPSEELQAMMAGSYAADHDRFDGFSTGDPQNAYIHAMRNGLNGESATAARARMNAFVARWMGSARNSSGQRAFFDIGVALHPIMDQFSPSHRGFKPWSGYMRRVGPVPFLNPGIGSHYVREAGIDPATLEAAVRELRNEYADAFGWEALFAAIQMSELRKPIPVVTTSWEVTGIVQ